MGDRCPACGADLVPGGEICLACGALLREGARGYRGRPTAIRACRWLVAAGWILWFVTAMLAAAGSDAGVLIPGILLIPVSLATLLVAAKAYCPSAWTLGLLNGVAWVLLAYIVDAKSPVVPACRPRNA